MKFPLHSFKIFFNRLLNIKQKGPYNSDKEILSLSIKEREELDWGHISPQKSETNKLYFAYKIKPFYHYFHDICPPLYHNAKQNNDFMYNDFDCIQ